MCGEPVRTGERVERDDGGPLPALQAVGGADGDPVDVPAAKQGLDDGGLRVVRHHDRNVGRLSGRDPSSVVRVAPSRACARSATAASIPGWFGSPVAGTSSDSISRCPAREVAGRAERNGKSYRGAIAATESGPSR